MEIVSSIEYISGILNYSCLTHNHECIYICSCALGTSSAFPSDLKSRFRPWFAFLPIKLLLLLFEAIRKIFNNVICDVMVRQTAYNACVNELTVHVPQSCYRLSMTHTIISWRHIIMTQNTAGLRKLVRSASAYELLGVRTR